MLIIRVPPQHKVLTWSVGHGATRTLFGMMVPVAHLKPLTAALVRFCVDKRENLKPFLA